LKVTPTAPNTLRRLPPQVGQTVSASSVNACWMSKAVPQSRHEYE
jgi:hypothetical protein